MKKIIAFLISALFVSAAFADVPVVEKSIATGSGKPRQCTRLKQ